MEAKGLFSLFCVSALAGVCQPGYSPYKSGAKLNWFQAKSFCEERGLTLPKLNDVLIALILSKYPTMKQKNFWGDGRCSWKNESGYDLNLTTQVYQKRTGPFTSRLCLECYGLPEQVPNAKSCIITADNSDNKFLPVIFSQNYCQTESVDFGEMCVGSSPSNPYWGYYSRDFYSNQYSNSGEMLEKIRNGVHLPVLTGKDATKYWIRLGTYSCTYNERPPSFDFSENGDCNFFSYGAYNQSHTMNPTDCGKALTNHIICYSAPTSNMTLVTLDPLIINGSRQMNTSEIYPKSNSVRLNISTSIYP